MKCCRCLLDNGSFVCILILVLDKRPQGGSLTSRRGILFFLFRNNGIDNAVRRCLLRVYLKTGNMTNSEGFFWCARHFSQEYLLYFKEFNAFPFHFT